MRLIARILALLLLPLAAFGQTATTAPKSITTGTGAAPVVITFPVPKNGWAKLVLTPANIPPLAVNIPALSVVPPTNATFNVVCTIPNDSNIITNPDGTKTITGMKCSFSAVTP